MNMHIYKNSYTKKYINENISKNKITNNIFIYIFIGVMEKTSGCSIKLDRNPQKDSPDFLSNERKVTIGGPSMVQINHAISLLNTKV
jgi:hypothetical protein